MYNKLIRFIYILSLVNILVLPAFCNTDICSTQYFDKCKYFLEQKQRFNYINFNALELSQEQVEEFKKLSDCNKDLYSNKLSEIVIAIKEYNDTKNCNINNMDKLSQKHNIKKLYRELNKISKKEDKSLKKILNREQRYTYRMIKHLERFDLKRNILPKKFYKYNPKMPIFGNLKD